MGLGLRGGGMRHEGLSLGAEKVQMVICFCITHTDLNVSMFEVGAETRVTVCVFTAAVSYYISKQYSV